jgi:hypothetical protein
MDYKSLLDEKFIMLLAGGVVALVISRIIKRGRTPGEHAGALENILFAAGLLLTVATLIFGFSRACTPAAEGEEVEEEAELTEFSKEPSGCSKPKKHMDSFKK